MIGHALAVAAAGLGPSVLARLAGPVGDEARAAAAELAALDEPARKLQRARWSAIARAPTPVGLRGVHPTWIEAAVAPLPARARDAVARGGGTAVDVWLARWATAEFPAMLPAAPWSAAPRSVDELLATGSTEQVFQWMFDIGADQLAYATSFAGDDALARVVQRRPRAREAASRIERAPRVGQLGPARAAISRCGGELDELGELRIGARAIAPYVAARSLGCRKLALRLARPLGLVVDAELRAHARDPIDSAPSWIAFTG